MKTEAGWSVHANVSYYMHATKTRKKSKEATDEDDDDDDAVCIIMKMVLPEKPRE